MLSDRALLLSRKEMKSLEQLGSLKGALSAPQQLSLISGCWDLREAVEGAIHIQVSGDRGVAGWGRDPASRGGDQGW